MMDLYKNYIIMDKKNKKSKSLNYININNIFFKNKNKYLKNNKFIDFKSKILKDNKNNINKSLITSYIKNKNKINSLNYRSNNTNNLKSFKNHLYKIKNKPIKKKLELKKKVFKLNKKINKVCNLYNKISNNLCYLYNENKIKNINYNDYYYSNSLIIKNYKILTLINPFILKFDKDHDNFIKFIMPYKNGIIFNKKLCIKLIEPFFLKSDIISKLNQSMKYLLKKSSKWLIIDTYSKKNSFIQIILFDKFFIKTKYNSFWDKLITKLIGNNLLNIENIGYYNIYNKDKQLKCSNSILMIESAIINIEKDIFYNEKWLYN